MKLKLFNYLFMYIMMIMYLMLMFISEVFLKWLIIELGSIIMIFILNINLLNKIVSIYYYMISVFTSIMFIFMIMMKINMSLNMNISLLIQCLLFMKLGIFPFNMWMIYCYEYMNWDEIFLMSTFMKVMPILLFFELDFNYNIMLLMIFNNLVVSFMSIKYWSMKKIIACSSINHTTIFIYMIYISKKLFFMYSLFYIMLFYMFINILNLNNINNKNDLLLLNNKYLKLLYNIIVIMYMMIPPFSMYMLKWTFMFEILKWNLYLWIWMFLYMITNLIMLWNYFNFINSTIYDLIKIKVLFNYKYFIWIFLFIFINMYLIYYFDLY